MEHLYSYSQYQDYRLSAQLCEEIATFLHRAEHVPVTLVWENLNEASNLLTFAKNEIELLKKSVNGGEKNLTVGAFIPEILSSGQIWEFWAERWFSTIHC